MNEHIGPMYVPEEKEEDFSIEKPYSQALDSLVDFEIRKIVQAAYFKAEEILKNNQDKLKIVNVL